LIKELRKRLAHYFTALKNRHYTVAPSSYIPGKKKHHEYAHGALLQSESF